MQRSCITLPTEIESNPICRCIEVGDQFYKEYLQEPEPDVVKRMKTLLAEREAQKQLLNQASPLTNPTEPAVP